MTTWMNLEGILLNEISQRNKNTMISLVCELSKTNIKQKQTQTGRKNGCGCHSVEGCDAHKIGEGDREVQTSSCKVTSHLRM